MRSKKKQPEGLVRILKERRRDHEIGSMMERVKMTQDAMERIQWEEKRCQQKYQTGCGVQQSMVCGDGIADGEEPKFVRCPLSEVVDQLKFEDEEKRKRMEEKRMVARRNRLMKEEEALRSEEADAAEKRRQREEYTVKSIDGLGEHNALFQTQKNTVQKRDMTSHSHWRDSLTDSDVDDDVKEDRAPPVPRRHQCNYDTIILDAVDSINKKEF